jgi:hypothetical protein
MASRSFSLRNLDKQLKDDVKRILNGPANMAFVNGEINLAVSLLFLGVPIAHTTTERLYGFEIIEKRRRTDQSSPRSVCSTQLPNCPTNSTRARQSIW